MVRRVVLLGNDLDAWLAFKLRLHMDTQKWTLSDLARHSGVSRQHVSNILMGKRSPSTRIWTRLFIAVGDDPSTWR